MARESSWRAGAGATVVTSPDGINWRLRTAGSVYLTGVAYGDGMFVAVGNEGTIISSPDGITWTLRASGNVRFSSVAHGNGIFVAAGTHQGTVMVSPDGIEWTPSTRGSQWYSIIFTGHEFAAGGDFGSFMFMSESASMSVGGRGATSSIAYQKGTFFCQNSYGIFAALRPLELRGPGMKGDTVQLKVLGAALGRAKLLGSADLVNWHTAAELNGRGEDSVTTTMPMGQSDTGFFRVETENQKDEL